MADVPPTSSVPEEQKSRINNIKELFAKKYGGEPAFFSRASGRVNLIGEHIDYCGYAVLPMAIEQDVVIAARPTDSGMIRICNTCPEQYSDYSCKASEIVIDKSRPLWHHYFLCGYKGIVDHYSLTPPVGMDIMLDGIVPRSAGLSSSSALVCCAAMATAKCNDKTITKLEFSEICQKCERHIGTEGGGMDQAISFLAQPGTAKLIEFNPVRPTDVSLPDGAVFVISNCCREMNKAATSHFNVRVAECRLACQVLAKKKGLDWKKVRVLGDLQNQLNVSLSDMVSLVKETFHEAPFTKAEICELLGVSAEELNEISLSEKTYHVETFKLRDRAMHVYSEADRVWQFKRVCDERPASALSQLGDLMNASHHSCSQSYECSCEELDELTEICRQAGALGSRLTGAGWGGCAVSLVPQDRLQSFLAQVKEKYYKKFPDCEKILSTALFSSKPGGGAAYYTVNLIDL